MFNALVGRYNVVRNVWEWGYWFNNTRFVVVAVTEGE